MKTYKFKLKGAGHQILMSPDQKIIATAGGSVRLFSSTDGKQLGENIAVLKYPHYLAFSRDSRFLAIKNTSGHIAVFDTLNNCIVCKNKITGVEGCGIYFTPDDKYIVTGDWDGNIVIFEWKENQYSILENFLDPQKNILINNIQYIPPYSFVFMDSSINSMLKVLWDYPFESNSYVKEYLECSLENTCLNNEMSVKFYNSNNVISLLKVLENGEIRCELQRLNENESFNSGYHFLRFSTWHPKGKYFATVVAYFNENHSFYERMSVRIFNLSHGRVVKEYYVKQNTMIHHVTFNESGEFLLIGTSSQGFCIEIGEIEKGEIHELLK